MPLVAIVFHVMETSTAIFPRHGKYSSTVWKKQVEQPPALNVVAMITKDQTRVSEKKHNNALHRTAHKLPKLHGLATINLVAASTYCACAPSGEA